MFVVCGEALFDVFTGDPTTTGLALDARIGGSPFNIALGLARLNRKVAFLGGISTDAFGERLMQSLEQEGINTDLVVRTKAPTTLSVVGLNAQGVPQYAFLGHNAADRVILFEQFPTLPEGVKVLQFGSYSLVVDPIGHALRKLAKLERGKRIIAYDPNVRLNVDANIDTWKALVDDMATTTDLLKVSDEDLESLYPSVEIEKIAKGWIAKGVRLVVVTCGGKDVLAWTSTAHVRVASQQVQVVDTVGAGDTFQAALLAWLDEHNLLESAQQLSELTEDQLNSALKFAGQAAAITCSRRGADLPRRSELAH